MFLSMVPAQSSHIFSIFSGFINNGFSFIKFHTLWVVNIIAFGTSLDYNQILCTCFQLFALVQDFL